jgi:hypothetical protein
MRSGNHNHKNESKHIQRFSRTDISATNWSVLVGEWLICSGNRLLYDYCFLLNPFKLIIHMSSSPPALYSPNNWQHGKVTRKAEGNWQPQRNHNFRELLAWVEHLFRDRAAQIEETATPFNSGWLQFSDIIVALQLPVSLVCPRPMKWVSTYPYRD